MVHNQPQIIVAHNKEWPNGSYFIAVLIVYPFISNLNQFYSQIRVLYIVNQMISPQGKTEDSL